MFSRSHALLLAAAAVALLSAHSAVAQPPDQVDLSNVSDICVDKLGLLVEACEDEIDILSNMDPDQTQDVDPATLPKASASCCAALSSYNDDRCNCDEGILELSEGFLGSDMGAQMATMIDQDCGFQMVQGDACGLR